MSKNSLRLALIGMSNIGKSYWSLQLEKIGYKRFCIDDMIAHKASLKDVTDMARRLGQPWSSGFAEREKLYLAWENQAVLEALSEMEQIDPEIPVVIDTTGSMFYTEQSTIDRLVQATKVVYLIAPEHVQQKMLQKYIDNPKPVIWNGMFTRKPYETIGEALARSYAELLSYRSRIYSQYADVVVGYDHRFSPDYTIAQFLSEINS